ncbi:hypothetical protein OG909_25645 [Streptomyces sp. NBC_01754]|uniref:hypothetical protein n=1 Tax=Streptomyces sp. NBC_01754 TaxID=2975930 RepID=UPI002DDAC0DF|nr:hypothetical protein [Streptomyces sp. NBC_01754]WSC95395.1 hypothetical protein OG909_25645 [Streptomyces sp. NBC_01754]
MRKARIAVVAALATVGLGITACDDGGDEAGPAKESPTASAEASSTPQERTPASDEGTEEKDVPAAEDVTKPGTKLKIGDRAVLPFTYGTSKKGTIAVTVTEIEKGAEADMAKFGDKAKGMTPYFIRMKVENVGGTDLSYSSLKLDGVLEGGGGTGVILIGGLPDKCDSKSAPADFKTKGASFETCSLSATKTAPVSAAEFDEGDAYSDDPVVWGN